MFASFIICALVYILIYVWNKRKLYYASFQLKGPTALPLIGNNLEFLGTTEDILKSSIRLVERYGRIFKLWIGPVYTVMITEPKDIEIVLNNPNCIAKSDFYKHFAIINGNSIFVQPNSSTWRYHRKLLSTRFNTRILNSFVSMFDEHSQELCKHLEKMTGKGSFDVYPFSEGYTLNAIFEAVLGVKVNIHTQHKEYAEWIDDMCTLLYKKIFGIWIYTDFMYKFTKEGNRFYETLKLCTNLMANIVETKHKEIDQLTEKDQNTILYFLLTSGNFTEQEIKDEAISFLVGGSHSLTGSLSFALMMLGMHQEIQEKVYKELYDIFQGSDRPTTREDLANMKYLGRVIKETLRLFPFAIWVSRTAEEDVQLRNCVVPKGGNLFVMIYHVQRDPELWPNPSKFDPDRFLPEKVAQRHPYSWIPFSGGPRNCIGLKYGLMSMKVMLSTAVRRFKVSCNYENVNAIRLKPDFNLKAVEGHNISLELRKQNK